MLYIRADNFTPMCSNFYHQAEFNSTTVTCLLWAALVALLELVDYRHSFSLISIQVDGSLISSLLVEQTGYWCLTSLNIAEMISDNIEQTCARSLLTRCLLCPTPPRVACSFNQER